MISRPLWSTQKLESAWGDAYVDPLTQNEMLVQIPREASKLTQQLAISSIINIILNKCSTLVSAIINKYKTNTVLSLNTCQKEKKRKKRESILLKTTAKTHPSSTSHRRSLLSLFGQPTLPIYTHTYVYVY